MAADAALPGARANAGNQVSAAPAKLTITGAPGGHFPLGECQGKRRPGPNLE
jgi:hypothetical protein